MAYSRAETAPPATVDTETASEVDAIIEKAAPQPAGARRRLVLAAAAASAVVAAGAIVSVAHPAAAESAGSAIVSASNSTLKHRVGCSNWEEIEIARFSGKSEAACHAECDGQPGCYAYNLQPSPCANVGANTGTATAGECIIFAKGCKEVSNTCWDLYIESAPTDGWSMSAARSGCSNWDSILIGQFPDKNAEECGAECTKRPECKKFNHQAVDGPCPKGGKAKNTCYLFKDGCNPVPNTCWDLYDYTAPRGTTTSAPGSTSTTA